MCDCGETDAGRYLGRIGGQLGDMATSKALRLADWGKGAIKSWTGLGDYQIKANSLITGNGPQTMAFQTNGRSTRIRWREYIGDVSTHPTTIGAFHPTTFIINPANLQTFPWLSTLATQFEQYKPRGIILEFRSTATDTTTNASLGSIMMASDYDLLDENYKNKSEMLLAAYSSEAKMTDDVLHGIECDPNELNRKIFFCRQRGSSSITPHAVDRDYDVCKTTVATQGGGLPAGQSVGSLYIHYDIEFYKEQIYGGIPAKNNLYASYRNTVSPATFLLHDFHMVHYHGYNFGIQVGTTTSKLHIPVEWAGGLFRISFRYSQSAGYTTTTPTALNLTHCIQETLPSNMMVGGNGWAVFYAPYHGTTLTAPPIAYAETYIRVNSPLSSEAVVEWPTSLTWGAFPSVPSTFAILVMNIELINTNYNV